jgi:hypothetical protein
MFLKNKDGKREKCSLKTRTDREKMFLKNKDRQKENVPQKQGQTERKCSLKTRTDNDKCSSEQGMTRKIGPMLIKRTGRQKLEGETDV